MVTQDDTCSRCGKHLYRDDFGFLCPDCSGADAARKAAKLRSLGLTPGFAKDDAVANANVARGSIAKEAAR
jgi:predicted RNA-binding Zn-ribbon protein involved in translation (DUF1610 family)